MKYLDVGEDGDQLLRSWLVLRWLGTETRGADQPLWRPTIELS